MCRLGPSPLVLAAAALVACSSTEAPRRQSSSADSAAAEQAEANGGQSTSDAHAVDAAPARSIEPARRVLAYRDGVARPMDERDASAAGLTIVDLRDGWAPSVLRGTPELPSSYETVYVDLANERGEPAHDSDPRAADYYLEVYGITPAPSIIRSRLEREEAAPCFATLDYDTLARFDGFLAYQGKSASNLQGKARAFQVLERRVQTLMRQQGVERPEDVTGTRDQALARQYLAQAARVLPLRAAQKRLECEGLFPGRGRYVADAFDWATHIGLLNFERRHRLYGWGYLNQDTARALAWWPREAALETLRRALAERIVDAAGVIEDGSTWSGEEPPTYLGADGSRHPVRNLVEEMTEAAMGHLGLNGPDEAAAFLAEHDFATLRVALPLPELPETELFDVAAYRESPRRSDLAGAGLASDPLDIAGDAAAGLAEISRTSFFGLKDQAQSVVVIWDVTRSMMNVSGRAGYERVRAEVARLVEGLNADTLFSVIIFAGGTERYSDALVYASRKERDAALAWIRAKNSASAPSPDGTRGANRSDWAIRDALQMGAEVIYLVTDGEPFYSASQPIPPEEIYRITDELQRKRRVPARLHTVGFGTDTNPRTRDFLQTLAGRNNGSFREIRAGETG